MIYICFLLSIFIFAFALIIYILQRIDSFITDPEPDYYYQMNDLQEQIYSLEKKMNQLFTIISDLKISNDNIYTDYTREQFNLTNKINYIEKLIYEKNISNDESAVKWAEEQKIKQKMKKSEAKLNRKTKNNK